jgi:predicted dehydrogenase
VSSLRIGYIGAGFLAQRVHIPNLVSLPEFELVALAEVRPELGAKVQKRYGIPKLYGDHRELADDGDIQAVAVSGHFSGQGEIAIDLLMAGKDVFMEKPMAVSVEQAQRMIEAERTSGRRLMIGYMKRYDAGNLMAKNLIDDVRASHELGDLLYVRSHDFSGNWLAGAEHFPSDESDEALPEVESAAPAWMTADVYDKYVWYLQEYTHNINLVRWLLDAGADVEVKSVDLDEDSGYDGVVVLRVGGVRTVIESGEIPNHTWDEHTELYFERGRIRLEAPPLLLRNMPVSIEVYRSDDRSTTRPFPESGWVWSYAEELKHFADCLRNDRPFRSPAADALVDVTVLEEIFRRFAEARPGQARDDVSMSK